MIRVTEAGKVVYLSDRNALGYSRCGAQKKIIVFIKRQQTDVIEKILRRRRLREYASARGPAALAVAVEG